VDDGSTVEQTADMVAGYFGLSHEKIAKQE